MILVVAEQRDGALNRASWEAVAAAQQMGGPVKLVVLGAGVAATAGELAAADVAEVIALEHDALNAYTADGFVQALAALIAAESPSHVVFTHTYQTRDYAPKLAARLDRALAADCIGLKDEAGLLFVRPIFQGRVNANVALEGPAPHLVTFQIGSFRADAVKKGAQPAAVKTLAASVDASAIRQ